MQVSWIDPEEVAALAESLRLPARPQPKVKAPEPAPRQEPVQPLVADTLPPEADDATSPTANTGTMPNLAAFRQRLQSIRERAISAGLLTPKALASPPVPAAPSEPVPAPQSQPWMETPLPSQVPAPVEPPPEAFTPSPAPLPYHPAAPIPAPVTEAPPPPPPAPLIEIAPEASVKDRLEAFAIWANQQWGPGELLIVDEYGDLLWGPPKKSGLVLSTMMAWNAAIRASAQAASGMAQIQQQVLATGETLTIIPCKTRLGMLQIALVKAIAPWGEETSLLNEALVQVMDIPG